MSVHPHTTLTEEEEKKQCNQYLDLNIVTEDQHLKYALHRKSTKSSRFIAVNSNIYYNTKHSFPSLNIQYSNELRKFNPRVTYDIPNR